ncbi:MAG: KpsF/GutQ family sugar-phosphate isomerase [Chitinophagaceae bacterium]
MSEPQHLLDCGKQVFVQEAQALQRIADGLDERFVQVVQLLHGCGGRVIVSGIGKSAIIAQKLVATFNSTGTPAVFVHAAEAIHGDLGVIQKNDIVLLVSKSGESPEIRHLVSVLRSWDNKMVALTSNENGYLGRHADYVLPVPIAQEACPNNLAPTTSTTVQLVMGDALAIALMQVNAFSKDDFARLHPGGNLGKRLLLSLSDIYPQNATPKVLLSSPLKAVIGSISQGRLGAVVVVDAADVVLGIITDGDIRRLLERVDDINSVTAADFYTAGGYDARPEMLAVEALDLMRRHDISQLVVVDGDKHFLGFVHLHDLVKEGLDG